MSDCTSEQVSEWWMSKEVSDWMNELQRKTEWICEYQQLSEWASEQVIK